MLPQMGNNSVSPTMYQACQETGNPDSFRGGSAKPRSLRTDLVLESSEYISIVILNAILFVYIFK